ncbi:AMP-binding protein [Gordonia sp. CPCC 205515]|uniref:AMP-binding protein n=1 Tax=Gordonia sp. CPCC 205515 TaxID=3140791 RepID=UPI003AF34718
MSSLFSPSPAHTPPPTAQTAVARWRAVADMRSDAIAVRTPEESITFGQAGERVDAWSRALAATITEPGRPIAVDVESDVASVVSILAVLGSGHPVILLDPLLPDDRRDHILGLSGAHRLDPAAIAALTPSDTPVPDPDPGDPAVIIFTSGSTGKPKGVVHAQRTWVNQALDGNLFMGLGPTDRAAVLLPLSFGAGFDCLVMTLLNGATLTLWDVRRRTTTGLREWLTGEQITTAHCTPSLVRSWLPELDSADAIPTLRLLSTCGEPVHSADVALIRSTLMPTGVFCSWSGSSEMGDLAFNVFGPDRPLPAGAIPVGTPASDKHVRILDDDGTDLPVGVAGEIVVESAHLALGYHGDPEQTARKFTPLADGRTRLHTGDLGRFDEEGQLHLLGRRDDAIKVRGYLVEPIEVEAALRAQRWTVDAVVTADRAAGQLTAHVAVDPDKWAPSAAEVRTALAKTLAPWMIPRDVIIMTELPRNERGKVDRAALPPPPPRRSDPVRGSTEVALMHIWCELLGLETIGRTEDFISLGGDSLAAARMLAAISERWLVDISTADFAQTPTIGALATQVDRGHRRRARHVDGDAPSELRSGTGNPLFIAAGAGGPAASLLPLARALDGDFPVYGLQAHGLEGRGRADRSIHAAARRAVKQIRALAPAGPYRLCGYSFGAFVMLEAASILRRQGADCEAVVLIDALFEPELRQRVMVDHSSHPDLRSERAALPQRGSEVVEVLPPQRRLLVWWNQTAMRFLVATAGLFRLPTTLQWTVFWDLGRQLLRNHRPTPYAGAARMILAAENPDDAEVWSRLVDGRLDVVRVPGDHHSMMRAPLVAATAAEIGVALAGHDDYRTGVDA